MPKTRSTKMNVLVTGSAGFIGHHLMAKLKEKGHEVLGVDKKSGTNLTDMGRFFQVVNQMMPKVDIIVHLAANCSTQKGIDDPIGDFQDNVVATFSVLELARHLKKPVIFSSSCKVYPNDQEMRTPYGTSKYVCEEYIREYKGTYDIPYIINRFGTVYGEEQGGSPETGWLAWFIKATVEQLPVTIFGDGKQSRDVLYISDATDLLTDQVENFEKYQNKHYDVGGGEDNEISLLKACEILGFTNYNFGKERLGDVYRFVSENKEIYKANGWYPKVGYEEGIAKTLQFEQKAYEQQ